MIPVAVAVVLPINILVVGLCTTILRIGEDDG